MTILYLVRHGETDWNKQKRWQGTTDIPLNETGREQARNLRDKVQTLDYEACICSPLARARETAEIINNGKAPVILDELLSERRFGDLEGTSPSNELVESLWSLDPEYKGDNIETLQNLLDRMAAFIEKMQKSGYEKVLVVTHGGTSKGIHYNLQGYNKRTDFRDWHVGNCEIVEVEV